MNSRWRWLDDWQDTLYSSTVVHLSCRLLDWTSSFLLCQLFLGSSCSSLWLTSFRVSGWTVVAQNKITPNSWAYGFLSQEDHVLGEILPFALGGVQPTSWQETELNCCEAAQVIEEQWCARIRMTTKSSTSNNQRLGSVGLIDGGSGRINKSFITSH